MRHKDQGSKDFTRVCEMCGTAWLLPKEWATEKAPNERQVKGMQRATKFAIGHRREKYSMQAATLQSSQDRVLTSSRCPSCGSTSFKQYKPGDAPAGIVTTPQAPQMGQGTSSVADEIAKLVQLRDAGALADEEFASQKAKLLNG